MVRVRDKKESVKLISERKIDRQTDKQAEGQTGISTDRVLACQLASQRQILLLK